MDYMLEIVSKSSESNGRVLKPYFVEGMDVVGVLAKENFGIIFRNKTPKPVQVVISIDGTNILNGEKATVSPSGKMWLVQPHSTLELEAWPETMEQGARFIFGGETESVAGNTHGDLSQRGIIAAAVFEESYVKPEYHWEKWNPYYPWEKCSDYFKDSYPRILLNEIADLSFNQSQDATARTMGESAVAVASNALDRGIKLEAPAVGAGETIKQAIKTVSGLVAPRLARTIAVKYLWWDHLKTKLNAYTTSPTSSSTPGFFNLDNDKLIDLKATPRIEQEKSLANPDRLR